MEFLLFQMMKKRLRACNLDDNFLNRLTRSDESSENETTTTKPPNEKVMIAVERDDEISKNEPKNKRLCTSDPDSHNDSCEDPTYKTPANTVSSSSDSANEDVISECNRGTRWRKSNTVMWKRNIRKKLYRRGEKHINTNGKEVPKKKKKKNKVNGKSQVQTKLQKNR